MSDLARKIQALLFHKGEPVSLKELASLAETDEKSVEEALSQIETTLSQTGLTLIKHNAEYTLGTHPEQGAFIETVTKAELSKDLGKAGLETLSIIAYRGPISRREIDYIRGVNSGFILRNLLVRGLVQKTTSKEDERITLYGPTLELLSYLGITDMKELPEFESVQKELQNEAHE